ASGTFNYSIPLTGGCGTVNATGTIIVTQANTAGTASAAPTLCINIPLTAITHTTTGATGIGTATGLPTGITAGWASNTITISGTPTTSGTFNYSIPLTGGCGSVNAAGTIIVTPANTITLSSATGTDVQTQCISTAITSITYATTGATSASYSGLPAGVSGIRNSNVITISGTPTVSGTFNYTITLNGGCGNVTKTGTIIVIPANTAGTASAAPTLCINTELTAITHTTTGATGIGTATGLPAGVTAGWASNVITISGTPTASGTFNYSIPLTGGCGSVNAIGTIIVTPVNTAGTASAAPTLCINTALTAITHTTTGATGIGTPTGLPTGVTAAWVSNVITINGTPTASGTFNYSIPLTGGCGSGNATGTIIVTSVNTITLSSAVGTDAQTKCLFGSTAIIPIKYATTGATFATYAGLPPGISGTWSANVITISGTPNVSGTFNYTITLIGGCGNVTKTGSIIITPDNTIILSSAAGTEAQTKCISTGITPITYTTIGATGATFTNLPAGVSGDWNDNVITISGTPTVSGAFGYKITLTGGCGGGFLTRSGSIIVTPNNTAGAATSSPTLCINTALTPIRHTTTVATGIGTPIGLPDGVIASFSNNAIMITGTPTVSGIFNYSIPLTGGCGSGVNATGTIKVTDVNTAVLISAAGTDNAQTKCLLTPITPIIYETIGATGVTYAGLPSGVSASFSSNRVTISGSSYSSGVFNYTITLTGGCGITTKTGLLTILPNNTITLSSAIETDNQIKCINTNIIPITYSTTGATGATFSGLPNGVSGSFSSDTVIISGTPSVPGGFNYTVTLTGGCGIVTISGRIIVKDNNTIKLTSDLSTTNQTKYINTAITPITYLTTGATGAAFTGLPIGVIGNFSSNTVTISGTPTAVSSSPYTVTLTGGCGIATISGTINAICRPIIGVIKLTQNPAVTNYTFQFSSTGSGSPTGVCSEIQFPLKLYTGENELHVNSQLYTDANLTTGFQGNSLWYKNSNGIVYLINNTGKIINTYTCQTSSTLNPGLLELTRGGISEHYGTYPSGGNFTWGNAYADIYLNSGVNLKAGDELTIEFQTYSTFSSPNHYYSVQYPPTAPENFTILPVMMAVSHTIVYDGINNVVRINLATPFSQIQNAHISTTASIKLTKINGTTLTFKPNRSVLLLSVPASGGVTFEYTN
ncbi:hypothetical protein J2Y38_004781, partial [Flavobacterium sp. 2755]|uniref:beta strand repeat-containing protein n=1 Tax=Flavobacterium sp. 2755 TaxID=2817765 RepID=UPI0028618978